MAHTTHTGTPVPATHTHTRARHTQYGTGRTGVAGDAQLATVVRRHAVDNVVGHVVRLENHHLPVKLVGDPLSARWRRKNGGGGVRRSPFARKRLSDHGPLPPLDSPNHCMPINRIPRSHRVNGHHSSYTRCHGRRRDKRCLASCASTFQHHGSRSTWRSATTKAGSATAAVAHRRVCSAPMATSVDENKNVSASRQGGEWHAVPQTPPSAARTVRGHPTTEPHPRQLVEVRGRRHAERPRLAKTRTSKGIDEDRHHTSVDDHCDETNPATPPPTHKRARTVGFEVGHDLKGEFIREVSQGHIARRKSAKHGGDR